MTVWPFAARICATEYPSRLLRMCPRCSGLLVLGDEYSIITVRPVAGACPKASSAAISAKRAAQKLLSSERFRKPFITLKALISGMLAVIYSPISVAVASGDLRLRRSSGNVTRV